MLQPKIEMLSKFRNSRSCPQPTIHSAHLSNDDILDRRPFNTVRCGVEGTRGPGHGIGVGRRATDGEDGAAHHHNLSLARAAIPLFELTHHRMGGKWQWSRRRRRKGIGRAALGKVGGVVIGWDSPSPREKGPGRGASPSGERPSGAHRCGRSSASARPLRRGERGLDTGDRGKFGPPREALDLGGILISPG